VVARQCRRLIHAAGEPKADVLINQTNDGWFWSRGADGYAPSPQQPQHLQIATLLSLDMPTPMVLSVNTGIMPVVDSAGRIDPIMDVNGKRVGVEGSVFAEVMLDDRKTLFLRLGEWPMWMLLLFTLTLCGVGFSRRQIER